MRCQICNMDEGPSLRASSSTRFRALGKLTEWVAFVCAGPAGHTLKVQPSRQSPQSLFSVGAVEQVTCDEIKNSNTTIPHGVYVPYVQTIPKQFVAMGALAT